MKKWAKISIILIFAISLLYQLVIGIIKFYKQKSDYKKYIIATSQWVNHGEPFGIRFEGYSLEELQKGEIIINDTILNTEINQYYNDFYYFEIEKKILKKDTINIKLNNRIFRIYDIVSEEIEGYNENHVKIKLPIVIYANVNGQKTDSTNLNIIIVKKLN
jgi:hypothetical protein